jgi:hypothetical protein
MSGRSLTSAKFSISKNLNLSQMIAVSVEKAVTGETHTPENENGRKRPKMRRIRRHEAEIHRFRR